MLSQEQVDLPKSANTATSHVMPDDEFKKWHKHFVIEVHNFNINKITCNIVITLTLLHYHRERDHFPPIHKNKWNILLQPSSINIHSSYS